MSFANQNVALILASNLLPSSHYNDNSDYNDKIIINGKRLYIGPPTYLSNFFYASYCLSIISFAYLSLFQVHAFSLTLQIFMLLPSQLFVIFHHTLLIHVAKHTTNAKHECLAKKHQMPRRNLMATPSFFFKGQLAILY